MNISFKRYLLFAGVNYYANGGMGDYEGDFDSLDMAQEAGDNLIGTGAQYRYIEWAQILDLETKKTWTTGWTLNGHWENRDEEEWEEREL